MSRIPDLGPKNIKLPEIVAQYEDTLKQAEADIKIEGKRLEHANREQPALQIYYDERRVELKILVEYLETNVAKVRGSLYYSYKNNHSLDLSDRGINELINNEQAYLEANELLLEIKEIYDKYVAVVDAFKSRGYALNNITKVRVAALEDMII